MAQFSGQASKPPHSSSLIPLDPRSTSRRSSAACIQNLCCTRSVGSRFLDLLSPQTFASQTSQQTTDLSSQREGREGDWNSFRLCIDDSPVWAKFWAKSCARMVKLFPRLSAPSFLSTFHNQIPCAQPSDLEKGDIDMGRPGNNGSYETSHMGKCTRSATDFANASASEKKV